MSEECQSNEILEFQNKFQDKLFELQSKRSTMKDLEAKMQKEILQKQDFQRSVEKAKREIQEMSVQLEVAIAAARKSESDRIANREVSARQKIHLQTTLMDRETLQEQIRTLEVETAQLKRLLQQSDEKLVKQNILQERCKNKEMQFKKSLEQLTSTIKATEDSHKKLKDLFNVINVANQHVTFLLVTKTDLITNLEEERNKLQEQVLSFTENLAKLKVENQTQKSYGCDENLLETELEKSLEEKEIAIKEKEKEIKDLQKALEMSFESIKHLEKQNANLQDDLNFWKNKANKSCSCQSENNSQSNDSSRSENSPVSTTSDKNGSVEKSPIVTENTPKKKTKRNKKSLFTANKNGDKETKKQNGVPQEEDNSERKINAMQQMEKEKSK
ncbi:restin homolog isoform X2 [Cimex lectularius]|uniref:Uncharacterized protein n=1 Tax=Cimex lectularius TaxID=79782 RepID=A0A8I6RUA9_CIMLE|nr:restin homolog isoform X2 [Cimex lectularius]